MTALNVDMNTQNRGLNKTFTPSFDFYGFGVKFESHLLVQLLPRINNMDLCKRSKIVVC